MNSLEQKVKALEAENAALKSQFNVRVETLKNTVAFYQKKVDELASPPLEYALFLGPSDVLVEGQNYIVLRNGKKHLVNADSRLDVPAKISSGELVVGQSILINSQANIVAIGNYPTQGAVGKVDSILSDGTLVVEMNLENKFIPFRGHHLKESVRVGDSVLVDQGMALSKVQEGDRLRTLEVLTADKSFEEIGALDDVKNALLQIFDDRLRHPEVLDFYHQHMPKGILLYGPPGCGKTTIAKAVMQRLNESLPEIFEEHLKFLRMYKGVLAKDAEALLKAEETKEKYNAIIPAKNATDLLEQILKGRGIDYANIEAEEKRISSVLSSGKKTICLYADPSKAKTKWLGDSEKHVREMFAELRACAKEYGIAAVILDEPEAILKTRGSGISTDINVDIVGVFNREMDGMVENGNIIVFLLTNRHDMIDPAVLRKGRIDRKFHIKRPETAEEARKIFQVYLNDKLFNDATIDKSEIEKHGSVQGAVDAIIASGLSELYENDSLSIADVTKTSGENKTYYLKDFVSGAVIEAIVDQTVQYAVDRGIAYLKQYTKSQTAPKKICEDDIISALQQVYTEEKFIPKEANLEEWGNVLGVDVREVHTPKKEPEERRRRGYSGGHS